ncbi:MAG TPA: hypothetical protein VNZ57_02675 [Longimicrobiales bacterium]|nr:hypothetical protein [Longimicrobiales bacterium]
MEIIANTLATGYGALTLAARRAWMAGALALGMLVVVSAWTDAAGQTTQPLRVTLDQQDRILTLEMGPFDLPANADHHGVPQPLPHVGPVPAAGYVHGYWLEVVDAQGRQVPRDVIHHINIITPDRRELFSNIMLRLGAAGRETGEIRLPRLLGHPVEEGQQVMLAGMLHNPTNTSYEGVRIRVHMPFTPADAFIKPITVYPIYMDVMPPASIHEYDLPPGRSEQSWEGSPEVPGRLLGVGGHLHKYGVALRLEDVTAGRVIWEVAPEVDAEGNVLSMPTKRFFWTLGVPLRPDHTYRLTAVYENPTGETIPGGAMGTLGGIFRPSSGYAWPALDRQHPDYLLDVQITERTLPGHPHAHGAEHEHAEMADPAAEHDHGAMTDAAADHDHSAPATPADAHQH